MINFNTIKQRIPSPIKRPFSNAKSGIELYFQKGKKIVSLLGIDAKFNIKNRNDIRRLSESFEGPYALDIIEFLKKLDNHSMVVNIGSAQGFYVVFAGLTGHKVVAIEPDPTTFIDLDKNISLNQLNNLVESRELALGASNEQINLSTDGSEGKAPRIGNPEGFKGTIPVQMARFDSEFNSENLPKMLIVDIEGYEYEFLKGMGDLRPEDIFIEIHPILLEKIGSNKEEVMEIFKKYGYRLEKTYERGGELHCHFTFKKSI